MSEKTNIKIEKTLAERIRKAAQKKFKYRTIDYNSGAVREVLIWFLKNEEELNKGRNSVSNDKIKENPKEVHAKNV